MELASRFSAAENSKRHDDSVKKNLRGLDHAFFYAPSGSWFRGLVWGRNHLFKGCHPSAGGARNSETAQLVTNGQRPLWTGTSLVVFFSSPASFCEHHACEQRPTKGSLATSSRTESYTRTDTKRCKSPLTQRLIGPS